ncbi:MAG: biotin--[acetyl-CoA-carboxylase] ligase [Elusimicrobiales bacterium]|nr:biotin--[acetyl-CoA-carboxylase] ligase [Elusimicrobiales bacterium]
MIKKFLISLYDIDSTQNLARDLIKKDYIQKYDMVTITAKKQYAGRGQRTNSWSSEKGGLYITIIRKTDENNFKKINNLSIQIADIISNILSKKCSIKTIIKPPNDIYAETQNGYKKISGILIETIPYKNIRWILIGIGINFQNKIPDCLKEKATNIYSLTSKYYKISYFIQEIEKELSNINI